MKNLVYIYVLLLAAVICPDASAAKREFKKLDPVSRIQLPKGVDVELAYGAEQKVVAEGEPGAMQAILCEVVDGELGIYVAKFKYKKSKKIKVCITLAEPLKYLYAYKANHVTCVNRIKADTLVVKTDNGADLQLNVEADRMVLNLKRASSIRLTGKLAELDASASDGSVLYTTNLQQCGRIRVKGEYDCEFKIWGEEFLDIYARHNCRIYYYQPAGAAKVVDVDVTCRLDELHK